MAFGDDGVSPAGRTRGMARVIERVPYAGAFWAWATGAAVLIGWSLQRPSDPAAPWFFRMNPTSAGTLVPAGFALWLKRRPPAGARVRGDERGG